TDPTRRSELTALANEVGAELAFLQMASPTLGDVLTRLAARGETRVVLVGVSGGLGGPGISWLRRIAADWWRSYGEGAPEVAAAPASSALHRRAADWWRSYGEGAPEVATAPAHLEKLSQWRSLVALARPITHGGPGLPSAAWEDIPSHRHQVFVCRGPRCTAA